MTDSVKDYLNEAARFPLLTTDQEIQLSRQVKRALELQATCLLYTSDAADD